MEDFTERFPHIAEQVFGQLDDKSLSACREVSHYWKHFIDRKNLPWHWQRILQIENVFKYRNTYLHITARTGQSAIFEEIDSKDVDKNSTPIHLDIEWNHLHVVDFLIATSREYNLNLIIKDKEGHKAFHRRSNCEKIDTTTHPFLQLLMCRYENSITSKQMVNSGFKASTFYMNKDIELVLVQNCRLAGFLVIFEQIWQIPKIQKMNLEIFYPNFLTKIMFN